MYLSNPSSFLFYPFHEINYPEDQSERKIYFRLHCASIKYKQYEYCRGKLEELIEEIESDDDYILNDEKNAMVGAYLDGLIVTSRTFVDLMVHGLLLKHGIDKIDSASTFLNKLDSKENLFHNVETFSYWKGLKEELFSDEFSWTSVLFRREGNRSLRDRTVHSQTINFYPILGSKKPHRFYLETGEKVIEREDLKIPIHKELKVFINEIDAGLNVMIENVKSEVNKLYGF
jgi:hypothetical protein